MNAIDATHRTIYDEVVQPKSVYAVSKYFLKRWSYYLTANETFFVIGGQQLAYRQKIQTVQVYDQAWAELSGLKLRTFQRITMNLKDRPVGNYVQEVMSPQYVKGDGRAKMGKTTYQVLSGDLLTPADTAFCIQYLQNNLLEEFSPNSLIRLVKQIYGIVLKDGVDTLSAPQSLIDSIPTSHPALTVSEIVKFVYGDQVNDVPEWEKFADQIHQELVGELLYIPAYFYQNWIKVIGTTNARIYLAMLSQFDHFYSGVITEPMDLKAFSSEVGVALRTVKRGIGSILESVDKRNGDIQFLYPTAVDNPDALGLESIKQENQRIVTLICMGNRIPLVDADCDKYLSANVQLNDASYPLMKASADQIEAANLDLYQMSGVSNLIESTPIESRYWWYPDQWFTSMADVVMRNKTVFLSMLDGLQESVWVQARQAKMSNSAVVGWLLYIDTSEGINNPSGLLVSKFKSGENPPSNYSGMAKKSWGTWRKAAVVKQLEWKKTFDKNEIFVRLANQFSSIPLGMDTGVCINLNEDNEDGVIKPDTLLSQDDSSAEDVAMETLLSNLHLSGLKRSAVYRLIESVHVTDLAVEICPNGTDSAYMLERMQNSLNFITGQVFQLPVKLIVCEGADHV